MTQPNEMHDIPCHCPACEKALEDCLNDPVFMEEYNKACREAAERDKIREEEQDALWTIVLDICNKHTFIENDHDGSEYSAVGGTAIEELKKKFIITSNNDL